MSKYIDVDKVTYNKIRESSLIDDLTDREMQTVIQVFRNLPAEDVNPVVYGEWIYREEWFDDEEKPRMAWGCNKCGFSLKDSHDKRGFCPNCGAKMEGGNKNDIS